MMMQHIEPGVYHRHRHVDGYVALVLSGGYEETGDTGRWSVDTGDIVYHRPYEAHANLIRKKCTVINISVPAFVELPSVFRIAHSDELTRVAEFDWCVLSELLVPVEAKRSRTADWCDQLAQDLQSGPVHLRHWASENGLWLETVSRQFKRIYGVTPARYRIEAQTRRALELIAHRSERLADIALQSGFSDQAHMSRAVKALTGHSPTAWLNVNSVQDIR